MENLKDMMGRCSGVEWKGRKEGLVFIEERMECCMRCLEGKKV